VGITIFVGLSVDYCLHTAHGYSGSPFNSRKERVQDMLTKLGISIAGAAITTAGSCIFLFFCHIFLFLQLGVMLFANCLIAVVFSLFFLSALMMVAGPLGRCGEIGYTLTCGCFRGGSGAGAGAIAGTGGNNSTSVVPIPEVMATPSLPTVTEEGNGNSAAAWEEVKEDENRPTESWDI